MARTGGQRAAVPSLTRPERPVYTRRMVPRHPPDPDQDWSAFVSEARERIAARTRALEEEGVAAPPGADATFRDRFEHLVAGLVEMLEDFPELATEPHGPDGLRVQFPPTGREVRVTPLEEQGFVHFVFGHGTLGTLHRAEHHASRPFGDDPPDVARLLRQILDFLVEGREPRWIARRPAPPSPSPAPSRQDDEGPVLELPLD